MQRFEREPADQTPIAIVGMACRLPAAAGLDELWRTLERERRDIVRLARDRWNPEFDGADLPSDVDPRCCERGCILPEFELDWRRLKMPPVQARKLHRMELAALASMVDALAAGGLEPSAEGHPWVRVFVASNTLGPDPRVDHGRRIRRFELHEPVRRALLETAGEQAEPLERAIIDAFEHSAPPIEADSMMTSASIAAGRLANIFNLQGGHVAIDADEASSLAALSEAITSLRLGECEQALVCGVSRLIGAPALLAAAHGGLLGSDDPRPFAPDADGSVLGEGSVAVLLARPEAVGNRRVHAWIEAVATAPVIANGGSAEAVATASSTALAAAELAPERVRFVESRAPGVLAHDRVEAQGLARGYATHTRSRRPLALASTATNFGELGAAAGLVAVVKAALCLDRGVWLGQTQAEELTLAPGLERATGHVALEPGERVGVSDLAVDRLAYHAVLAEPRAHQPCKRSGPATIRRAQPIAIIGMGARAPGADCVDAFWANTLAQIDAIGDMPTSRWDVDLVAGSDPNVGAVLHTRLAATVPDPRLDDDPRWTCVQHEREELDPAVLLCLQSSAELLDKLGPTLARLDPRRIGVVFGQLPVRARELEAGKRSLFAAQLALTARTLRAQGFAPEQIAATLAAARRVFEHDARLGGPRLGPHTQAQQSSLPCAQRVAACFDLRGPLLTVDAACASSLAAIHMAVNNLAIGASDLMLAGGVAFNLLPEYYISLSSLGTLSTRGAPPFTTATNGFVPGEGAGVVALRRLADAERDGDPIAAVIEGVGCCSDGRGTSIFAPNSAGQQRAMRRAITAAGLRPAQIDCVEGHGTGTRLGDDTELHSIIAVYGHRDRGRPLSLSSVKSQIGHLSGGAGLLGLIKTALAVRTRILPAGCGDGDPLPRLASSRIGLAAHPRPWISRTPRHAGVSAFGIGGASYHVIVGEPPSRADQEPLDLPLPPPVHAQEADRFVVELTVLERSVRPPSYPLAGRRLLVLPDPAQRICPAVEAALRARGARVVRVTPGHAVEPLFLGDDPCTGIIDLRCFASPTRDAQDLLTELSSFAPSSFALLRSAYEQLEAGGCYVALTAMGGDLGLLGGEHGSLLGAYLLGLSKGLKQELPQAQIKTIDFDPHTDPAELAEFALAEIEDGNDRMEVGWAGRRFVTKLERRNFDDGDPLIGWLAPGDVFVFSGGSRGVVFECALALARLGIRVVVSGRTELPPANAAWLGLDEEGFANFRARLLAQRRAEDPHLTPAAFAREFARYKQQRELDRNLARARALGLSVEYESCDIMDRASVHAMLDRVRTRLGRIDGVGHGAMLEWSRSLPGKTDDIVHKTTMVKVAGLVHLLEATREDRLRVFVAFGSGAGRFGNRGQTDYSAANSLLATLLRSKVQALGNETHCVTIDWTAWREVGAAADDRDLAERVRETGVSSICVEEGVWHFANELFRGDAHEVVILSEDMLWRWPFLGSHAEGAGERRRSTDQRGEPLVPGEWPMLDRVGPTSSSFARRLTVDDDHFLSEHRLDGAPILPATFACELLAEAAAITSPGWSIEAVEDFEITAPVKLGSEGVVDLRGDVELLDEGERWRVLEVSTCSDLVLRGRTLQRDRPHSRARVVLRRGRPAPLHPPTSAPLDEGERLRARSVFASVREPVTLGPQFLRAQWLRIRGDEIIGTIRPPRARTLMSRSAMPQFLLDPLTLDTAIQVCANWDALTNHWVSVPRGIGRVRPGARVRRPRELTRVWARAERVSQSAVFYELVIFGDDDEPLLSAENVWMQRVARVPPEQLGLAPTRAGGGRSPC